MSDKITCGVVMPISKIDEVYTEEHWKDVFGMIKRSADGITKYSIETVMVSTSYESHIIHNTIVDNLYKSEIVVCDLSANNPNVMFELGIRLAFGKPVILIKDSSTKFIFDTGIIDHIEYDRDLRYNHVTTIQEKLINRLVATYESSTADNYIPLIHQFGSYELIDNKNNENKTSKLPLDEIVPMIHSNTSKILNEVRKLSLLQSPQMTKDEMADAFIESYMKKHGMDNTNLVGRIDKIVQAACKDSKMLKFFNADTEDISKAIGGVVLKRL